jgi:hypothetical protein
VESITVCLAPGFLRYKAISEGSPDPAASKARDNAAFGVEPQGKGLTNQVAYRRATADLADFACKRSYYGGIVTGYRYSSRKGGHIAS